MPSFSAKKRIVLYNLLLIPVFFLAACSTQTPNYETVGKFDTLDQLQQLHAAVLKNKKDITRLHSQALQDIAISIGAQAGLAWRSKEINESLEKNAYYLDHVFDFNLMLLDHSILPPVLVQSVNSLNLDDPQTLRIDDRLYQIVTQARFVTAPPQWRNYLWMDYPPPDKPLPAFLPKTSDERAIWREYATKGWKEGHVQADTIFSGNLARLTRDYNGMLLYRSLLLKHMVSKPFVAHTDLGVTGDSSGLRINDQIYRITALPELQVNPKRWKPVITHHVKLPAAH